MNCFWMMENLSRWKKEIQTGNIPQKMSVMFPVEHLLNQVEGGSVKKRTPIA